MLSLLRKLLLKLINHIKEFVNLAAVLCTLKSLITSYPRGDAPYTVYPVIPGVVHFLLLPVVFLQ